MKDDERSEKSPSGLLSWELISLESGRTQFFQVLSDLVLHHLRANAVLINGGGGRAFRSTGTQVHTVCMCGVLDNFYAE